jgi:hypothetical protein
MQTLKKGLAFGVRSLQNHPAFALTAILTSPADDRLPGGVGGQAAPFAATEKGKSKQL